MMDLIKHFDFQEDNLVEQTITAGKLANHDTQTTKPGAIMNSRPLGSSNDHDRDPIPLKILSWNIHDGSSVEGKKVDDATFLSIISQADIFCLQETKQEIKIPNYRCYNSLRSDSRSGGVCLGIKNNLMDILKPINTRDYSSDFQAFSMSKAVLGTQNEVVIINVYDSPAASSYKAKKAAEGDTSTTLSNLDAFCKSLPQDVLFFMAGDLNARTGGSATISANNDQVIQQLIEGTFPLDVNAPKRNSKDATLNENGKRLIDFGCEWNLKILNGTTIGDLLGDWTCYRYNGTSVIDYMMASHSLQDHVSYFKVLDLTEHSASGPSCATFMQRVSKIQSFPRYRRTISRTSHWVTSGSQLTKNLR